MKIKGDLKDMPKKSNSIIILTCKDYPLGNASLQGLSQNLLVDYNVDFCVWQELDCSKLDDRTLVLPLAVWDYSMKIDEFLTFLGAIKAYNIATLNPLKLIHWNLNKLYLEQLGRQFPIIPSVIITPDEIKALDSNECLNLIYHKAESLQSSEIVIKPLIGQSGNYVRRIQMGNTKEDFCKKDYPQGILVQKFIKDCDGEVCLIFFDSTFQYAIKRVLAHNNWRANSMYGIQIIPIVAEKKWLEIAQNALNFIYELNHEMPLYARVDLLISNGIFINEIELIEPNLYFDTLQVAQSHFIDGIAKRLLGMENL